MARPSERDRYKYGICTNRDKNGEGTPCPKCESKEVQKVSNKVNNLHRSRNR